MDPVSQAALGAIAARSVAPADMAKGVVIAGLALGAAPDLDVVFSIDGDFFDTLKHHRGITHSLIVLLAVGPLAGHWLWRRFGDGLRWRRQHLWWLAIATAALLSHPLLDGLTTYGTQWLAPFSDRRFAVNAMPIIDPLYTLILLGGLGAGAWLKSPRLRKASALVALALSCAYLAYGWAQNRETAQFAAEQLEAEGLVDYELSAFPTILQVHYRRVVVRTPDEVRVGFFSTWSPCAIEWGRAAAHPWSGRIGLGGNPGRSHLRLVHHGLELSHRAANGPRLSGHPERSAVRRHLGPGGELLLHRRPVRCGLAAARAADRARLQPGPGSPQF